MNKRDEIITSIKNSEDRIFAVKIIDYIEQVQKYYEPRFTDFLDPAQVMKASRIIHKFDEVEHHVTCGVDNCERNLLAILPPHLSLEEVSLPVDALCIKGSSKFEKLEHRDILGALMSLGVKRQKLGDIILNNDISYILVSNEISYYIKMNLSKIRHVSVTVEYINLKDVPAKEEKFKEVASNVASLRLDAILSSGFGESRSSISKEITSGNVKVNWEEVTDLNRLIKEGDVISLKGRGRIVLESIGSKTKKDRINIIIKKII